MRADRLRQRREELGLTQAELGNRMGIEPQAIYRYEKGQSDPVSETVAKIAKELEVSADWLLGLVDEPNARLTEAELSPTERKLLDAVRKGLLVEAMETTIELTKQPDKTNVPGTKPAASS